MTNWILVPVRNNLGFTHRAVKSFLKQDIPEVRVLMIDNASTDGTPEWARCMYPSVVYIRREPGLSVAESWNKGLSLLFEGTGNEHVLVCNNDVELRPDTYSKLLGNGGGFVTGVGVNSREQMAGDEFTVTFHPDFSCYLIKKWVWDKVGKFDEGFKGAFCEDWDYHVRLHQAGVAAVSAGVPFYHIGSATINNMHDEERDALCKQADSNRAYFQRKWGVAGGSQEYYDLFKNHSGHGDH